MQATPRRDPKSFAQRTMAAAIAASAIAVFGLETSAQTTGGGIGAAVNSNPGASGNLPTQGTTGSTGGTTTSGVAAPNAPANPLRPGTGPGINNTGSPVLATPRNLQAPIGGSPGRTPGGTARIPGNTVPVPPANTTRGLNGANLPQPTTAPERTPVRGALTPALTPRTAPNTSAVDRRPGANLRTGVITNFTDTSISFREGANTSTFVINADTVVQMDGKNITLREIPSNALVRIERNPRFANTVERIVVVPAAAVTGAANANANSAGNTLSASGGTSVNAQTGTGSTGSANRSLQDRADIGDFGGATSATRTGTATTNAATQADTSASAAASNTNTSDRPLAPGSTNPADQPVSPFTRGPELPRQAGFNEPATQNQTQPQNAPTDGSQFLGPVSGAGVSKPRSTSSSSGVGTEALDQNQAVTRPNSPVTPIGDDPSGGQTSTRPPAQLFTTALGNRFGAQMIDTNQGLTLGNITNQSLAARAGLRAGDRIQSINGTNVTTAADFGRALQAANQNQAAINASVLRNGTAQNVSLSLPNGFFNGINVPPVTAGPAANTIGTAVNGAGNISVAPDGSVGVNAGGVFVPATGQTQVGAAGAAAATTTQAPATQTTTEQQTFVQGQAPARVRPVDPPVGTQRSGVTTEALKIPDINLGWTLKATPEGVVMSSVVEDGIAAKNLFQSGDIIESIDDRPITAPGAVSYELHRHRAGATVKFSILRNGQRITEDVTLPESHKPLLLNRNETFGAANNAAKEQGASGARPVPVKPTEESIRTLEAENKALRKELEELRKNK